MITEMLLDFAITVDHKMKIKENDMIDKYLNVPRELKKNFAICGWWLYQLQLVHFKRSPNVCKGDWNSWKSVEELDYYV